MKTEKNYYHTTTVTNSFTTINNMLKETLMKFHLLLFVLQMAANAQNINQDDDSENPEETGPYLEGDINGEADGLRQSKRNGIISASYKWPHATVPYKIEGSFKTNELNIISHALNEYHSKTCIRFRKRTSEKDYVAITNKPSGCWASVGRMGRRQEVNLQSGKCFNNYGTTIHELMHALGFYHEQNRFERDSYVKVLKENVKPNMLVNFEKLPHATASGYGIAYDYGSIMHYKATSFSKNGKPTLQAVKAIAEASKMGQRHGFSQGDILKIKAMYRCA